MSCLFWVLMLASFGTVVATGLSNQLMLFKKDPGVLHQSPNSTTVTCSDGSCSVFECTRACMERGDCVVYSHSPAAGLCVLGGPVHANTSTVDVVDDAWDTYKRLCPIQAGYAQYNYQGSMVCLRVVKERMSHAAAVSRCAEHRASLVMVKDENYDLFLRQLLIDKNVPGRYWVGAEKQETDQEYYWLDGTYLPETDTSGGSWGFLVMRGGEQCVVRGVFYFIFGLVDLHCRSDASVVCQFFL